MNAQCFEFKGFNFTSTVHGRRQAGDATSRQFCLVPMLNFKPFKTPPSFAIIIGRTSSSSRK
jgi:hypothetical protein